MGFFVVLKIENPLHEVRNLKLSKYGRIGKAPLIRAIGIQKNHKEVIYTETQELDRIASGCFSCPNYNNIDFLEYLPEEVQKVAINCCEHCPHAVYKTVTHESYKYINEKNMFGSSPRLKSIALKLLLIYHFSYPDDNGFVKGISPKELAEMLGCTVRSIKNANNTLQKYGYIMYCSDAFNKNRIQVMLPEYKTYCLTADQGGRGYATFNLDCLQELLKIKSLNQLRIFLRMALEIDTNRNTANELIISKDYGFFRRFLPQYCKPGVIRDALDHESNIFSIGYDGDEIYLKMNPTYHGRRNYEENNEKHTSMIENYVTKLDEVMKRVNQKVINQEKISPDDIKFLTDEGISKRLITPNKKEFFVSFNLQPDDFKDLGLLCTTYSFEKVKECIRYIYNNYGTRFKIESIGALTRTVLKEKMGLPDMSLLFANA